jgi:GWxTD domain-containing protein
MRRFLLVVGLTLSISAADQPRFLEFGQGPMQWLMTRDEQRAWRSVKTEEQARDFVDLFWARRDPTPGTPINEFRQEAESRVVYADQNFKEPRKRGSLSERGRVLMVLGFPKNLDREAEKRTSQFAGGSTGASDPMDPTGGRVQDAREMWEYDHARSVKYKMPKIDVVFLHDPMRGGARRDPQRTDFTSALPHAINYYVKNPELTSVPEWAKSGLRFVEPPAAGATPAQAVEVVVPFAQNPTAGTAVAALPPAALVAAKPAGAGRLTLVADAFAIDAQAGRDPFASLASVSTFGREAELGWAAEYCTGKAATDVETVSVALKVSGLINGQRVNFNAPADDLAPDAIKGSPGCYVVRGGVPLSEMDPGDYTLTVAIAGPNGQGSYNLTRDFKVE